MREHSAIGKKADVSHPHSLAQAKANAPLFGGLIEGLKRRVWL